MPLWHLFVHIGSLESLENHIWPMCTSVELKIVEYYSLCLGLGPFLTLKAVMGQAAEYDSRASDQSCEMQPLFPGNFSSSHSPIPQIPAGNVQPLYGV